MKLIAEFKDDQYPFVGINHKREIARAILINDNNEICLEWILDDDMFGHRDYYETPGGGIKPFETREQALLRELEEEVGFKGEIIQELGEIKDYYNLIYRENHNYYYLVKIIGRCEQRLEPDEKTRIKSVFFVSIDKAIDLYEHMQNELVGKLVKQRELPILKLAKTALQNLSKNI